MRSRPPASILLSILFQERFEAPPAKRHGLYFLDVLRFGRLSQDFHYFFDLIFREVDVEIQMFRKVVPFVSNGHAQMQPHLVFFRDILHSEPSIWILASLETDLGLRKPDHQIIEFQAAVGVALKIIFGISRPPLLHLSLMPQS